MLPKDLDPDPGNTDAIEGWLFTCLIGFCLVRETFSWLEISSQWLFSMLAAGDQLTYYWVTLYVHPRSARSRKPCIVQTEPVERVKIFEFRKHIQKVIFVENKLFYIPWLLQTLPYISFEEVYDYFIPEFYGGQLCFTHFFSINGTSLSQLC